MDGSTAQDPNELPQSPISRQINQPPPSPVSTQPVEPVPPPESPQPKKSILSLGNILKLFVGLLAVMAFFVVLFGVVFPKIGGKTGIVELSYSGVLEDPRVMQNIFADFEKENPNIKVNFDKEDTKDYRERLTSKINNGTGPDVFTFHNSWYPELQSILLPLPSEVITKDAFEKGYYPVTKKDLVKKGAIYGIPLSMDTLSLFVNSDLFKQAGQTPPKNWNDFMNTARFLTVKDQNGKIKTSGAAFGTYDNVAHAGDLVSLLFLQDGVDLSTLEPKDKVADALNFYTSFAREDSSVWDNTLDPSTLAFSKGNLAMFFGYYWDFFTIKSANPNLSFEVLPVPQVSGQNLNIASYWASGVSAKGVHQKEALLLMKFLARKDIQEKLYQEGVKVRSFGQPYAGLDNGDKLKATPIYTFVSQGKTADSTYFSSQTDNGLNSKLNDSLGQAINSIINNSASPDSVAGTLSSSFSQILGEFTAK